MTEIPNTIGNYKIERQLGEGGMADVYLATHLLMNRQFAVKIMKPEICAKDPMGTKRFVREAQLAQKVHHPNVVRVFDVGEDPNTGLLYLVMEYVEGVTLDKYSREKTIPSKEIRKIACDMAKALIALDEQGIVHRDIKPSNIMLCNDGTLKLMDLGIAKNLHVEKDGEMTLTMENSVLGTPAYASPEQCSDSKSVDIRSDIYCLGASLYAIALGRPPYGGTTAMEVLLKVIDEKPQPISNVRSDLEPDLVALIEWMMEKSPDKRPQTPRDLLVALVSRKISRKGHWRFGIAVIMALVLVFALLFGLWKEYGKRKAEAKMAAAREEYRRQRTKAKEEARKRGTLEERLASVQKKLAKEAKTSKYDNRYISLRIKDYANNTDFVIQHFDVFKVLLHQAQYYRIEEQIKRRDLALNPDKSKFDAEATAKLQEKINKSIIGYGSNYGNFPYNLLMQNIKSGKIDPNMEVEISRGRKLSEPLLYLILRGERNNKNRKELVLELLKLGVNANDILKVEKENADTPWKLQLRGKLEMSEEYLTVLTTGGIDKLEHRLIPLLQDISKSKWRIPFIQDLILLNHDVLEKDGQGNTALHYAARNGLFDVAALLVASGADVNARNNSNETPLFEAAKTGKANVEKLLLKLGADATVQDKEGSTALHYAARNDIFDVVALLLASGADVNARNNSNETPLFEAARTGRTAVEKQLLASGADTTVQNNEGKTFDYYRDIGLFKNAALACDVEKLRVYLEKGFSPNTVLKENNNTLLEYACAKENVEMVELLLKYKANTELHNAQKYTPLAMVKLDKPLQDNKIFTLLLEHGANPNVDNPHGKGFLLDALLCNRDDYSIYIKELFAKSKPSIGYHKSYFEIFAPKNSTVLPLILDHIKEFKNDIPVLAYALAFDAPDDIIKILIEKKANVNCVFLGGTFDYTSGEDIAFPKMYQEQFLKDERLDEYSRTALYIAVERRRLDTVKLLLEHGAEKDWIDGKGKNILHLETSEEIKELLK